VIKFDVTSMFFDSKKVISATDRATRRVLSRFGAFVRRTAKTSIRKRKKISQPGSPPSSHTGLLKKFIYFGYDATRRAVVVGAMRFSRRGNGEAPGLLEHGGTTTLTDRRGKKKSAKYKARPFMGPAFEKENPKLPAMWKDSVY